LRSHLALKDRRSVLSGCETMTAFMLLRLGSRATEKQKQYYRCFFPHLSHVLLVRMYVRYGVWDSFFDPLQDLLTPESDLANE